MFSLFSSGYCAAAHAFGDLPMQAKAEDSAMKDMPDCHGMNTNTPDNDKNHHPAKSDNMNCKACCASLIGNLASLPGNGIEDGNLKFPVFDSAAKSDIRFRIFHPPKSSA